jgi:hypothetical protein
MNGLLGIQILAIVTPFIAPFLFDGYKSWLGWVLVTILLLLILVPSISIPVIANNSKNEEPAQSFKIILLILICLVIAYCIFWIVGIVFAFTKYKCATNGCLVIRKIKAI